MALTFLSPCRGRMRSGLCWSSGIMRLMAHFWLNSKKVVGARMGRTDEGAARQRLEPKTGQGGTALGSLVRGRFACAPTRSRRESTGRT